MRGASGVRASASAALFMRPGRPTARPQRFGMTVHHRRAWGGWRLGADYRGGGHEGPDGDEVGGHWGARRCRRTMGPSAGGTKPPRNAGTGGARWGLAAAQATAPSRRRARPRGAACARAGFARRPGARSSPRPPEAMRPFVQGHGIIRRVVLKDVVISRWREASCLASRGWPRGRACPPCPAASSASAQAGFLAGRWAPCAGPGSA